MKYESPITYHSKVIANVKVFAMDKQTNRQTNRQTDKQTNRLTDKQTDRPKTICPQICDSGGIKSLIAYAPGRKVKSGAV